MSLDGEKAGIYALAFGMHERMCAKRLVAGVDALVYARKSCQICSHADSREIAGSIRRSSGHRLPKRVGISSASACILN